MLLINNDNQEKPLSLNETIIGYLQARRIDHRDYSDHLSRGAAPTYPGSSRRSYRLPPREGPPSENGRSIDIRTVQLRRLRLEP